MAMNYCLSQRGWIELELDIISTPKCVAENPVRYRHVLDVGTQ